MNYDPYIIKQIAMGHAVTLATPGTPAQIIVENATMIEAYLLGTDRQKRDLGKAVRVGADPK